MCRRAGRDAGISLLCALALGLGSAYWTFATHLYGHAAAAAFGLLAASVVFFRQAGLRRWLACGLLAGTAVLVEYPAAIVVAALGLLAVAATLDRHGAPGRHHSAWTMARSPVAAYAAGGTMALGPLPIYAWLSFGSPLAIGYGYVDDPAFAGARQGLFGVGLPTLEAAAEVLVGPVGAFTQTPFLLLALPGLALWLFGRRWTREALASAAIVLGFVFVNAGYYLPLGGQALGPRFLVPTLPFLALAGAWSPRLLATIGAATLPYSISVAAAAVFVYPKAAHPGWGNLVGYWLSALASGDLAPNWGEVRFGLTDLASLVPLAAVAIVACACAAGLAVGSPSRQRRAAAAAGLAAAAVAGLALTLPADIAHPTRPLAGFIQSVSLADAPAQLRVGFGGELELLGYRIADDSVAPGEAVRLDLYWRRLQPVSSRYVVYVHAFGRDGVKLGGFDAVPGAGSYPAEMWPTDRAIRDTYRVRVPVDARTPSALSLRVGVYESGSMRQLMATDSAGKEIGAGPALVRLRLGEPVLTPPPAIRARLGEQIGLVGVSLDRTSARPGDELSGAVAWTALRRPERDYTAFIQFVGPGGVLAQWDSQPLAGQYPTGLWLPNEAVVDAFRLLIPPAAAPGEYSVIAGMYDLASMERLAGPDGLDYVQVGRINVRPR
jgi:hypothetical protein